MHSKKKPSANSSWILCPSKSLPGKFYYFNVRTGEAVWSISDEEKAALNSNNRCNIQEKNIPEYPEPSYSPEQHLDTTPTNVLPNTSTNQSNEQQTSQNHSAQHAPIFGQQATFPNNLSQVMPIFLVPIQWPGANWPFGDTKKPMIDRLTQTSLADEEDIVQNSSNYDILLGSKDKPTNYFSSALQKSSNKTQCDLFTFGNHVSPSKVNASTFASSTPKKKNAQSNLFIFGNQVPFSKTNTDNKITGTIESQTQNVFDLRHILDKRKKLDENLKNVEKKKNEIQNVNTPQKKKVSFDFSNLNVNHDSSDDVSEEPPNKKPASTYALKSINSDDLISKDNSLRNADCMGLQSISTQTDCQPLSVPNNMPIIDNGMSNMSIKENNYDTNKILINNNKNTDVITQYSIFDQNSECYDNNFSLTKEDLSENNTTIDNIEVINDNMFIVCDMDVLLDEFKFIDKLLQSDDKYRLLIPHALRAEIETLCIGDCRGQQRVLVARQLSRRWATPHKQYIVEKAPLTENSDESTIEGILNCCLRYSKEQHCLILITNNPYLSSRAKSLRIVCYTPQDIKNGAVKKADPYIKKIIITVPITNQNDEIKSKKNSSIFDFVQENNKHNLPSNFIETQNDNFDLVPNEQYSHHKSDLAINDKNNPQKVTTASKNWVAKIISNLPEKFHRDEEENFKIPSSLPFKKRMQNTSTLVDASDTTDNVNSNFENSRVSLEKCLEKYCVKSKAMVDKVKNRMDEWVCIYTQTMEELLDNVLQDNSEYTNQLNISITSLQKSLTCIKMMYDDMELRGVIELFVDILTKCTCKNGKIKLDIEPNDFMKIIGCGLLLIEKLKKILPTTEALTECQYNLQLLLHSIEHDRDCLDTELLRPTTVCRSEVDNCKDQIRLNYTKDRKYIINYLKKHYKAWSNDADDSNVGNKNTPKKNINVVRTIGKNLNLLTIGNNKSISYNNTTINTTTSRNDESKLIKHLQNDNLKFTSNNNDINTETKLIRINENHNSKKAEPKTIEHEKRTTKEPLDLNIDNYSIKTMEISESITTGNYCSQIDGFRKNDHHLYEDILSESNYELTDKESNPLPANNSSETNSMTENGRFEEYFNHNNVGQAISTKIVSNSSQNDDSSSTSGFENVNTQTYTFLTMFLSDLGVYLDNIYEFILDTITEFYAAKVAVDKMNGLHIIASKLLQDMVAIMRELQWIAERESAENTILKNALLGAGVEASSDKRVTRYRPILLKCLEQAQILENALKAIVCITFDDFEAIKQNTTNSHIKYLNIFE